MVYTAAWKYLWRLLATDMCYFGNFFLFDFPLVKPKHVRGYSDESPVIRVRGLGSR